MITRLLIHWFPETVQSFWHSLPIIAFYLTELIAWIFFIGLILLILTIIQRSYTLVAVRRFNHRIQGFDWNPLDIPERLVKLHDWSGSIPVLQWAIDRIRHLENYSKQQTTENVVDICLMRYRDNGFFSLFTRLSILIGLMGTLIGLTISVKDIFNFIDVEKINTVEQLRSSLQATLNGLGTAFTATLAGVFSATFLSPFLVWSRSCTLRLVRDLDSTLSLTILPLVTTSDQDFAQQVHTLVEKVSRQVVENVVSDVVRDTAGSLNDLSLRLVEAVNTTGTRQADIVGVVMKLNTASQGFQDAATRSQEVLGQLNERLVALSQMISQFTPDHESRLDLVKTVGQVLEEELAEHWAGVRRQNAEQLLQIQKINETIAQLETALNKAAATICSELTPIQSQGNSILPKMNQAMQDIHHRLGDHNTWLQNQSKQVSDQLTHIHQSIQEISIIQERQTERWVQLFQTYQATFEQFLQRMEEQITWGISSDKYLAALGKPVSGISDVNQSIEAPNSSTNAAQQDTLAMGQLLSHQFQQSLRSWKQIDAELHHTTQSLNHLIEILQPDNRFLRRWIRKWWAK